MMIKIGEIYLFSLSSRVMLHFKDKVSSTCVEADLRFCFNGGVSRAHYVDTSSWFNIVAYMHLHIVILAVVLILLL